MNHQIPITHQPPDLSLLTGLTWDYGSNLQHEELAEHLVDKNPYTITVILDNLDWRYHNRKTHVHKTRLPRTSRYVELLHESLTTEFGKVAADKQYGEWLDKYRQRWLDEGQIKNIDDYVLELEMGPLYRQSIEKRHKNLKKLHQPRSTLHRERYYSLPEPITRVDWRSPYDNLFIWKDGNHKYVARGGSGSSGARETNSRFIFALGLLNQKQPVPSHLFLYDKANQLHQLASFPTLTVPRYDIGENYYLDDTQEKQLLKGTHFIEWEDFAELQKLFIEENE